MCGQSDKANQSMSKMSEFRADKAPSLLPDAPILTLIAALTLARLVIANRTGLVFDEAYYRLWGLAPSWAYYDHAPMVAWWIAIGQSIIGDNALGVRLLGPISAGIGSLLLWRTACLLWTRPIADRAVYAFNAMLLPSLGSIVMTPDVPNVFFWGASLWSLAELRSSRNRMWWLVIGLAVGLTLLSKYSGVFLGLGIVAWLILKRDHRFWLARWEPYAAAIFALSLFAPVVLWNMNHDFVSFAKQLARTRGDDLNPKFLLELIGSQWALMTPILGGFALIAFARGFISVFKFNPSPRTLLIASSLPFVIYLLLHALHDRVNANWPAPLTPAFALLAAEALEITRWIRLRKFALASAYALVLLLGAEIVHPFLPIQPDRNPIMLTQGWTELGEEIESIAKSQNASWIATSTYEHTGALSYALRGKLDVVQINERLRYGFMPQPDASETSKPALYIIWENDADRALKALSACIGTTEKIGMLARRYNDTIIENFALYRLTDVRISPPLYDRKADPSRCR